jgi:hypothetical protein
MWGNLRGFSTPVAENEARPKAGLRSAEAALTAPAGNLLVPLADGPQLGRADREDPQADPRRHLPEPASLLTVSDDGRMTVEAVYDADRPGAGEWSKRAAELADEVWWTIADRRMGRVR